MGEIFKYYWPAILWAIFIFTICNIPMGGVSNSPMFFVGFDKVTHCGLFFTMVVLYSNCLLRGRHKTVLTAGTAIFITLAIIFYGGVIELLQYYIFTWRTGDWNDLSADAIGACMGIFSVYVTTRSVSNA